MKASPGFIVSFSYLFYCSGSLSALSLCGFQRKGSKKPPNSTKLTGEKKDRVETKNNAKKGEYRNYFYHTNSKYELYKKLFANRFKISTQKGDFSTFYGHKLFPWLGSVDQVIFFLRQYFTDLYFRPI